MTNSNDNLVVGSPNDELFTLIFVRAAREYRDFEAPNDYTDLLNIIRRVEAGEKLEDLAAERERLFAEANERCGAEDLAKPEPKDKTSDEWRYWKLRRVEAALESGSQEEALAAMNYFRELLTVAQDESSFYLIPTVKNLLPHLIIFWQKVESMDKPERTPRRKSRDA